jgi:hypothetical protein
VHVLSAMFSDFRRGNLDGTAKRFRVEIFFASRAVFPAIGLSRGPLDVVDADAVAHSSYGPAGAFLAGS